MIKYFGKFCFVGSVILKLTVNIQEILTKHCFGAAAKTTLTTTI